MLRGPNAGLPIIVNHNDPGIGLRSIVYVDSPEGVGAFSELNAPPEGGFGLDQPIWPDVAGVSDGSIALAGARSTACRVYVTLNSNFVSYSPWEGPLLYDCSGRYVLEASESGRIGLVYTAANSLRLYESSAGSLTWRDTILTPLPIVIGSDTFTIWGSIDFVYLNNEPVVVMALQKVNRPPTNDGAVIGFWSRATGPRIAVQRNVISGIADTLNRRQSRHLSMGYPVIGISGQYPVIGFQAFIRDTSLSGFNYSDAFWTFSIDGGQNWISPMNLSFTARLNERYPSMSRWNHGGPSMAEANMVWQEDTEPGSHVFDGAPVSRSKQVFGLRRIIWNSAEEKNQQPPHEFSLSQNYPNPFNPTTNIVYSVGSRGSVELSVFDVLGRKVATLVNEVKAPGEYEVELNAEKLSSGVYYYQLRAGSFIETKKMILIQ